MRNKWLKLSVFEHRILLYTNFSQYSKFSYDQSTIKFSCLNSQPWFSFFNWTTMPSQFRSLCPHQSLLITYSTFYRLHSAGVNLGMLYFLCKCKRFVLQWVFALICSSRLIFPPAFSSHKHQYCSFTPFAGPTAALYKVGSLQCTGALQRLANHIHFPHYENTPF